MKCDMSFIVLFKENGLVHLKGKYGKDNEAGLGISIDISFI